MDQRLKFAFYTPISSFCFTCLFLLGAYVLAPISTFAQDNDKIELVNQQSLLWKISGNGLREPSYLYGTIHAICVEDLLISDAMQRAMQNSRQLALEVNVSNTAELNQMQAGLQMPTSLRLTDFLSVSEYSLIERFYRDSLGINLQQLQHMKPFFTSSLLYSKLLDCAVISYEMQLSRIMGMQNKQVIGLEAALEQVNVLDAISYQEQAQLLLEAVQKYDELKADYWNLVVSYKNKDLESLFYIVRQVSLGAKRYEKLLLVDRNHRWMPNIETFVRSKPTFIAVGAAHLPGEDGLVKLLRRRGYTVEPVVE